MKFKVGDLVAEKVGTMHYALCVITGFQKKEYGDIATGYCLHNTSSKGFEDFSKKWNADNWINLNDCLMMEKGWLK